MNLVLSEANPTNLDVYNIFRSEEPDSSPLDSYFNSQEGLSLFQF